MRYIVFACLLGVFDIGASGASTKELAQPARAGPGSRAAAGKPWSVPEAPISMPKWPIWGLRIFRILGTWARNPLANMSVRRPYKGMPLEIFVISGGF
jgi:hypothetical protein